MARRNGRGAWNGRLTGREKGIGGVFFLVYLTLFPFLSAWVWRFLDDKFNIWFSYASERVIYFVVIAVLLFIIFWELLKNGVSVLLDDPGVNLIGFLAGLSGAVIAGFLVNRIPLPVVDPTAQSYTEMYLIEHGSTVAILIVLMPIVEELFFRGLVFGWLRSHSRVLAYVVSCLLFCLAGVWQFAFTSGDWRYLLLAVRLLPTAVALCWSYDHGGSIWCPMALHMALNAIDLFGIVSA